MIIESGGMNIELLGPLSVRINQVPVASRRKAHGRPCRTGTPGAGDGSCDRGVGDQPPPSALTTLQTYILDLRKRMAAAMGPGEDPKRVLRTRHFGYLLDAQDAQIDIEEFSRLALAGRAAAEAGNFRGAAELLGCALALWRGPALVDVRRGRVLELEATALEESRLAVLSRRIEADLVLGRHADILGELMALAARHPLNENFSAQLITALYRTGHTARALQAFHRLRSSLVDELGIEPSAQLQRLQQAVLSRDPSLTPPERDSTAPVFGDTPADTGLEGSGPDDMPKTAQIDISQQHAV
jgi:DNA-binding SARP family transcriptional activator